MFPNEPCTSVSAPHPSQWINRVDKLKVLTQTDCMGREGGYSAIANIDDYTVKIVTVDVEWTMHCGRSDFTVFNPSSVKRSRL